MAYTREEALEILLKSYRAYYNIVPAEPEEAPLAARCEFFEFSQKYVLSKKAELWSANSEEFIYLYSVPRLTLSLFQELKDRTYEDGMKRIHVGPGHMYSYLTPIFICDSVDDEVWPVLKKLRIYKSFHFSFHGWMDFHVGAVDLNQSEITANRSGRSVAKILKKILYPKGKEKET